jgi:predicted amidohydrolase
LVNAVKVSTISFTGSGEGNSTEERVEGNRRAALQLLERAAQDKPDIVCLPETFTGLGLETKEWFKSAEGVPGPTTEALAKIAKRESMYVVCPMVERHKGRTYNSAVLLDRLGDVAGSYHKMHPTIHELEAGITPGAEPTVLKADFGPVGFAICFDLNYRDVGMGLKEGGAKLAFFPSMYAGGLQLSIWAHDLGLYVASAYTGDGSAIVDPLGRALVRSSAYMPIISRTINLDFELLHIDYNNERWEDMKGKYGPGIEIDVATPEAIFALYSNRKDVTTKDLLREYKLETRDEYLERADALRQKALAAAIGRKVVV